MENSNSRILEAEQIKLRPVINSFERAVSLWWKHLKTFILIYWQGGKTSAYSFINFYYLVFS